MSLTKAGERGSGCVAVELEVGEDNAEDGGEEKIEEKGEFEMREEGDERGPESGPRVLFVVEEFKVVKRLLSSSSSWFTNTFLLPGE